MIAERNPEIRKATDALHTLSADPAVRAEYEMHEKAWRDRISQFHDDREAACFIRSPVIHGNQVSTTCRACHQI